MTTVSYPSPAESANLSSRKKLRHWKLWRPIGLDLSGLPLGSHESAIYIVSLIVQQRIYDQSLKYEEYVPLKKEYLRKYIPKEELEFVLDYLIHETKQIECDGLYYSEKSGGKGKCLGYKLSEDLEAAKPTVHYVHDALLRRKLSAWKREKNKGKHRPVHKHLTAWLNKVEVDDLMAAEAIEELCRKPLKQREPWESQKPSSAKVRRRHRRLYAQAAVLDLKDEAELVITVDPYGRGHSIITNLPTELRKCLRIDGHHLVGLDIVNSQPLVLAVLLSQQQKSVLTGVSLKSKLGGGEAGMPLLCPNHDNDIWNQDLSAFRKACEEGRFYESMAGYELTDPQVRNTFKQCFFQEVLFGKNKRKTRSLTAFQTSFPTAWKIICDIKRKDHCHLSHNLQRCESKIIFAICDRLRIEHPHVPLVTIHDSILTTPDHVSTVRTYILDEFATYGFTPSLKEETYA
jgi:hypothetical protein